MLPVRLERSAQRRPRPRAGFLRRAVVALVVVAVAVTGATALSGVLLVAALAGVDEQPAAASPLTDALDIEAIPLAALEHLDDVRRIVADTCPDLPLPWLIALVEAESSWQPRAYSSAGAAGLVQMMPASWEVATGSRGNWPAGGRPAESHAVWQPVAHLEAAVPWMCGNLRSMERYLAAVDKPITPLEAMTVCHIAGCGRVTGSASGVPAPGEAGCGAACSDEVRRYVERITTLAASYTGGVVLDVVDGLPAAPAPYTGGSTGCTSPDPTTTGCLTGATAHVVAQIEARVGRWPWGVSCWDEHAWNPRSDHPEGQACDYFVGRAGAFPAEPDVEVGWVLAEWLRRYAGPLRIDYVIWQGRIWSAGRSGEGWRSYDGGGIYRPTSATGGHYDHLHVSVAR